jgi:four helix bundle protein
MDKKELEKRLIDFSVEVSECIIELPKHPVVIHLREQIIRSSTATALNYGEAQSAESKKDFIHKINIVMKELRETKVNLMLIQRIKTFNSNDRIKELVRENDELLAIFYKTLKTAKKNIRSI